MSETLCIHVIERQIRYSQARTIQLSVMQDALSFESCITL
jgi:hypothetical protein